MSASQDRETLDKAGRALELVKLEKDPEVIKHLARVLEMIEDFNQLDLEGVEPMITPLDGATPLRQDKPDKTLPRSDALADAPDTQAGFFRTPRPN